MLQKCLEVLISVCKMFISVINAFKRYTDIRGCVTLCSLATPPPRCPQKTGEKNIKKHRVLHSIINSSQ